MVKDDLTEPNLFDFAITYDQPYNNYIGIAKYQGTHLNDSIFAPVGNMFKPYPEYPHYDFYNEGNDIEYYYHALNQTGFRLRPQHIYGTVRTHPIYEYFIENYCPSTLSGSGSSEELDQMMMAQSRYDSLGDAMIALVDGGSTEILNMEVQTSSPPDALQVRNELLNGSPYLSDTVMKTSVGKEDVLDNAMIRDVLVANPQSAKSEEINEMLANRSNPMPDYMMEQILAGEDTISAKEILEAKKAWWDGEATKLYTRLINHYKGDSLSPANDDNLRWLFDYRNTLAARYNKADWIQAMGEYEQAIEELVSIPALFILNTVQASTHQAYLEFYNISKSIQSDSLFVFRVDSTQTELLQSIVQSNKDLPGGYARNILLAAGKIMYQEPIILPDTGLKVIKKEKFRGVKETDKGKFISVFPNPANDYFIVRIKLPDTPKQGLLTLYDATGKIILVFEVANKYNQLIIPTTHLKSGMYLLELKINGKREGTAKITILQ